jgi:hypothetical protein
MAKRLAQTGPMKSRKLRTLSGRGACAAQTRWTDDGSGFELVENDLKLPILQPRAAS